MNGDAATPDAELTSVSHVPAAAVSLAVALQVGGVPPPVLQELDIVQVAPEMSPEVEKDAPVAGVTVINLNVTLVVNGT
jgi:hypothetical protein